MDGVERNRSGIAGVECVRTPVTTVATMHRTIREKLFLLATVAVLAGGCSNDDDGGANDASDPTAPDSPLADPAESEPAEPDPVEPDPAEPDPAEPDPVEPDPSTPGTVRTDIDITVPVYQSDALQVRLVVDETTTAEARWLGGQSWEASVDVPADTFFSALVHFFDRNGEVLIASKASFLELETTGGKTLQIDGSGYRFWDTDRDGVNNGDELQAGTDPFVDEEGTPLENFPGGTEFSEPLDTLSRASRFFEADTPAERPYIERLEERPDGDGEFLEGITRTLSIDIDESGNGTFADDFSEITPAGIKELERTATRSRGAGSVTWEGSYTLVDQSDGLRETIEFTTETRRPNERTYRQDGTVYRDFSATFSREDEIAYSVSGGDSGQGEGTCDIVAGTITIAELYNVNGSEFLPLVTTVEKSADEPLSNWRVTVVKDDVLLEDYEVADLEGTFYCDFADL